jgi:D-lyxose ketol-isomerase
MKRSEINAAVRAAKKAFSEHDWILPPNPRWDVTDFGLGDFKRYGLTLINLAEQPEYCEKLMFVLRDQITPHHCHKAKKEDIICRWGRLAIDLRANAPNVELQINNEWRDVPVDRPLELHAGERVTLTQGLRHAFRAVTDYAIVGEVSTANDDACDNFFDRADIGRFSEIEEDEPALVKIVSDGSRSRE